MPNQELSYPISRAMAVPAAAGSLTSSSITTASLAGMRIAYVITRSDTLGGAHTHVADIAQRFQEDGAVVRVFVGGEGPFTESLRERGVPYVALMHLCRPIRPLRDVRAVVELQRALSKFQPDLVAAHSAKAGLLARLAARTAGFPVVFTAHGWAFTEGVSLTSRWLFEALERWAAPLASRIITVSDYDRRLALSRRVSDSGRIRIVHNGMPDLEPALRARPALAGPRLISVARLEEPKDHDSLLQAVAGINRSWSLELVGDGPRAESVRRRIQALGLQDRVSLLGLRRDVPDLLSKCAVFVLVSNWEGLPISIIEAMRAGLPVVASDVGGVSELVEDGVTGFLIPRGDVPALRDRLLMLLEDRDARAAMGRAARQRYEQAFHFDRMVGATAAVYLEALGRTSQL